MQSTGVVMHRGVSLCVGGWRRWGCGVLCFSALKGRFDFSVFFSLVGVWRLRWCQTVKSELWIALTMQHLGLARSELGCFAPYLLHVVVRWMWCHAALWGWGQAWCWHTDGAQRAEARFLRWRWTVWRFSFSFLFYCHNARHIYLSTLPVFIAHLLIILLTIIYGFAELIF